MAHRERELARTTTLAQQNVQRQLLAETELLQSELAGQRVEIAMKATGALEKRLAEVAAYNHAG